MRLLSWNVNQFRNRCEKLVVEKQVEFILDCFSNKGVALVSLQEVACNTPLYKDFINSFNREEFSILEPIIDKKRASRIKFKNLIIAKKNQKIKQEDVAFTKSARSIKVILNDTNILGIHIPNAISDKDGKMTFWEELHSYAEKNIDNNTIIIGDFNGVYRNEDGTGIDWDSTLKMKELVDKNWTDTFLLESAEKNDDEKYTWKRKRLDYAFISPKFREMESVQIQTTHLYTDLSDHAAILLEIIDK
ncbi:hypothetical protein A0U40_16220 [[Bacillus] sp. KCTC 13219]|nr:hypothetical protein A0U40_16220 [[Bacillus] sp. KCTC 13219]